MQQSGLSPQIEPGMRVSIGRTALCLSAIILLAVEARGSAPLVQGQAEESRLHRPKTISKAFSFEVDQRSGDSKRADRSAEGPTDSLNEGDDKESKPVQAPDPQKKQSADRPQDDKRGEWVIAPIPIKSPALGAGLAWVVGYVFSFDKQEKTAPPSMVGTGGLATDNGSRGIALGGRLYLKEDRYRVSMAGGHASINVDLFGVGKVAGDRGLSVPLNIKGGAFFTESLFRIAKGFYRGPRFQYRNLRLSISRRDSDVPDDIEINPPPDVADIITVIRDNLFRQRTIALGPRFQWDTRDNTFYPKRGVFMDSGIDLFSEKLGSEFTYQYYKVAFNKYTGIGENQVLAIRGVGCAAGGNRVPVYDLCLFGVMNDLRGYPTGRYQDRRMFATQAEYRLTIPKTGFIGRFGAVAFAGVGGVGPRFADIGINEMLPSGGGGIRFRLTKKNPINFRIDYGVGKNGGVLSIGVGEAF